MKSCKYEFNKLGIQAMENDSLDLISSAINGENQDFDISELDFKVTIGNLEIEIPCFAHNFEALFAALGDILEVHEEES